MPTSTPSLFGISNSNRDFSKEDSWGKNNFNSSFPAALTAYMASKSIDSNYIVVDDKLKTSHTSILLEDLFGLAYNNPDIYYAFEAAHTPFQQFVIGNLPRVDLVIMNSNTGNSLRGLEVKLTALPDNTTCEKTDALYGTELVIRPDTIVYLACSIASHFKSNRGDLMAIFGSDFNSLSDWSDPSEVVLYLEKILGVLDSISLEMTAFQKPLIIQPVWKTKGKSPVLVENCLDVFVWSDLAFIRLFHDISKRILSSKNPRISRQVRTSIWLFKMLFDFARSGNFDHHTIIDSLSYNTKNDKAFAVSGLVTQPYMKSTNLTNPRIKKTELKNIILGGGQLLLSPERRFDAIVYNSPHLF